MAVFDTAWKYKRKIIIASGKVGSDLTNFPVLVDLSHLPQDFWTNVNSDGGDIRITTSDQTSEVPLEVVSINTSTKVGELYFKAPTVSAASNNTFYLYFGNSSGSLRSASHSYGRNNVWSNSYKVVYHLNENPSGSAPQAIDATGNGYDSSSTGMVSGDLVTGKIGNAINFDGSDNLYSGTDIALDNNFTIETWVYNSGSGVQTLVQWGQNSVANKRRDLILNSGTPQYSANGGDVVATAGITSSTWSHVACSVNGSLAVAHYKNGATNGTGTTSHAAFTATSTRLGINNASGEKLNGKLDEVRISSTTRSADWIAASYSNQNAPGSFYYIEETTGANDIAAPWYNASWGKRIPVIIDRTKISTQMTDFPVLLDLANLNSGFFTDVKSDGGDIRITLGDGVTELAREVVYITTGSSIGEVHFKHPYISSVANDTIYIYYKNASASDYASTATYGRNNVWVGYIGVWHMNQDPSGGAPQMTDSTVNANNLTSAGSMTSGDLVTGKVGKAIDLDGTNDTLTVADNATLETTAVTLETWIRMNTEGNNSTVFGRAGGGNAPYKIRMYSTNQIEGQIYNGTGIVESPKLTIGTDLQSDNSTWYHLGTTYSSSDGMRIYLNGSQFSSTTGGNGGISVSQNQGLEFAYSSADSSYMGCLMDEARISSSVRSASWMLTTYKTLNANNTFYSSFGTPEAGILADPLLCFW